MAGHSQFKNIMYRKGAQDKKRAKIFAKLTREIMVAAKSGTPDPLYNARLRAAVQEARAHNMPKDNIERAIKKSTENAKESFSAIRYEGFGPAGIGIIVEALTDNHNRTASDVRAALTKNGGSLGETGSVSFMFERLGCIAYPEQAIPSLDAALEKALAVSANDCTFEEETYLFYTDPTTLWEVAKNLEKEIGQEPVKVGLIWKPNILAPCPEDKRDTLFNLLEALEENDDVQNVFTNVE